jgi:hypothetical protein
MQVDLMTPFTIKLTLQNKSSQTKRFYIGIPDPQTKRNYVPPNPKTIWTDQGNNSLIFSKHFIRARS